MIRNFNGIRNKYLGKQSKLFQDITKYYSNLSQKQQSNIEAAIDIQNIKSFDEIPGPKIWPVIGNLFELKGFGKLRQTYSQ